MSKYVSRDGQNNVTGAFTALQPGVAEEELADDHPDLVTFFEERMRPPLRRNLIKEMDELKAVLVSKAVLTAKDVEVSAEVVLL